MLGHRPPSTDTREKFPKFRMQDLTFPCWTAIPTGSGEEWACPLADKSFRRESQWPPSWHPALRRGR